MSVVIVRHIPADCLSRCFAELNQFETATDRQRRVDAVMAALRALPPRGSFQAIISNPGLFMGLARIGSPAESHQEHREWGLLFDGSPWRGPTQSTVCITDQEVVHALENSEIDFDRHFGDLAVCVARLKAQAAAAAVQHDTAPTPTSRQSMPRGGGRQTTGAKKTPTLKARKRPTPHVAQSRGDNQTQAAAVVAIPGKGHGPAVRKATPPADQRKHKRSISMKHWK